jgi:hypothetical protein
VARRAFFVVSPPAPPPIASGRPFSCPPELRPRASLVGGWNCEGKWTGVCGTESFVLVGAAGKRLNRGRVGSLVTTKCANVDRHTAHIS